jgi:hypothetical protein
VCRAAGSRIHVPIFSRATTFESAKVAAAMGTSSRAWIGSLRARSRVVTSTPPISSAYAALRAA